jgi:hypothetical protein
MMRINRPERRTADLSTPLRGTGGVMGLRPTQGDEKTPFVRGRSPMGAPPSPLSSRPKRSAVERSLC